MIVGQGPAVLAAGMGWKLFDFLGGYFFSTSNRFAIEFLVFWHFSVTYNLSFTTVICISMPYQLNVFFLHIS